MTDDRGRGIGIGAPGLGKPLPSPGAECVASVTVTSIYSYTWPGYTAADAAANRYERLKASGAKPTRNGTTVAWDDGYVHTVIVFSDQPEQTEAGR